MAEGRAGALEDYATAAFSVSGVKQDISLEDWKGGWASIVGGLNGKPTSQQFYGETDCGPAGCIRADGRL